MDDAIIVVENAFRRLREARRNGDDRPAREIVREGTGAVLNAIFFATLIIVLVFVPLFFLPGMEGRLLRPLGFAYVVALAASLLVSVTVTPVLCWWLLRDPRVLDQEEPWLMRRLGPWYERRLGGALARPRRAFLITAGLVIALAAVLLSWLTGNPLYDALGTCLIGVILLIVAIFLAGLVRRLIIGLSVDDDMRQSIESLWEQRDFEVLNMIAVWHGPNAIMLALKVRPANEDQDAGTLITALNEVEAELQQVHPEIMHVFVEPDHER